jgi:hypothetical protein
MIYEETSGTSPETIYETGITSVYSTWGFSWANSWSISWDRFIAPIYNTSSGTNPDPIYEEN